MSDKEGIINERRAINQRAIKREYGKTKRGHEITKSERSYNMSDAYSRVSIKSVNEFLISFDFEKSC